MRNRQRGLNRPRNLRIEPLEKRLALAGDVLVTIAGGELRITGDTAANSIEITQGATAGSYIITGRAGTTVNAGASVDSSTIGGGVFAGSIVINMDDGDDDVFLLGITSTPSGIEIDGDGVGATPTQDDNVEIGVDSANANAIAPVTINGALNIDNASSVDIRSSFINAATSSSINGTPAANSSALNNSFTIVQTTFAHDLALDSGNGAINSTYDIDQVQAVNVTINGNDGVDTIAQIANSHFSQLSINLGIGSDVVTSIANSTINGGNLTIVLGTGDDVVTSINNVTVNVGGDVAIDLGAGDDSLTLNALTVSGGDFTLNAGAGVGGQIESIVIGNTSAVVIVGNLNVNLQADDKDFSQDRTVVTGSQSITGGSGKSKTTIVGSHILGALTIDYATNAGAAGGEIDVHDSSIGGNATFRTGANGDIIKIYDSVVAGDLVAEGGAGGDTITIGDLTLNATSTVSAGSISINAAAGGDTVAIGSQTSSVVSLDDLTIVLGLGGDSLTQFSTTVLGDETITDSDGTSANMVSINKSGVVGALSVTVAEGKFAASALSVVQTAIVNAGSINVISSHLVGTAIFASGSANATTITINNSTFGSDMYMRGGQTGQNHLTLLNSVVARSLVVNKDGNGAAITTDQNVIFLNTNQTAATYIDGGTGVDNVSVLASVMQGIFASLGADNDSMSVSNLICSNGEFDGGAGTNAMALNNTNFSRFIKVNFG